MGLWKKTARIYSVERVNENAKLPTLPQNKSFTLAYRLESEDPNLSPRIDTQDAQVILERNRLNKPILDYVKDGRSNNSSDDQSIEKPFKCSTCQSSFISRLVCP